MGYCGNEEANDVASSGTFGRERKLRPQKRIVGG